MNIKVQVINEDGKVRLKFPQTSIGMMSHLKSGLYTATFTEVGIEVSDQQKYHFHSEVLPQFLNICKRGGQDMTEKEAIEFLEQKYELPQHPSKKQYSVFIDQVKALIQEFE